MKSIMHDKKAGTCYLCMMLNGDSTRRVNLEEHHAIFGTSGRHLAEKYGLKVYLCHEHHTGSSEAVHVNHKNARIIQRAAQLAFETHYEDKSFLGVFGRNYLIEGDEEEND